MKKTVNNGKGGNNESNRKVHENRSCFLQNINKVGKPVARLSETPKKRHKHTIIRNEKRAVSIDYTNLQKQSMI